MTAGLQRFAPDQPLPIHVVATGQGRIGMCGCPGRQEPASLTRPAWRRDLRLDLETLKRWRTTALITLLEDWEMQHLHVAALPERALRCGFDWCHLPITDGGAPDEQFTLAWRTVGAQLRDRLRQGQSVVLQSKDGLGRAGMVAAQLLIELDGCPPFEAMSWIRAAHPGAIASVAQEAYLRHLPQRTESGPFPRGDTSPWQRGRSDA